MGAVKETRHEIDEERAESVKISLNFAPRHGARNNTRHQNTRPSHTGAAQPAVDSRLVVLVGVRAVRICVVPLIHEYASSALFSTLFQTKVYTQRW